MNAKTGSSEDIQSQSRDYDHRSFATVRPRVTKRLHRLLYRQVRKRPEQISANWPVPGLSPYDAESLRKNSESECSSDAAELLELR